MTERNNEQEIHQQQQQRQQQQQTTLGVQHDVDDDDDDEVPALVSIQEQHHSLVRDCDEADTIHTTPKLVAQQLTFPTSSPPPPSPPPLNTIASKTAKPSLAYSSSTTTAPKVITPIPCCPVTILSGFLGSGKTTLIQHLLQSPDHGKRIAVIENEFGDGSLSDNNVNENNNSDKAGLQRSIESLIARDISNQNKDSLSDWIELPNGCLCCTVKDKLVTTLEHLISIKGAELDCILIEMSGMALPGPLASLFWLDDDNDERDTLATSNTTAINNTSSSIQSRLRLDGIVTVVDAYHIESQLRNMHEAACQIAQADRILVNKMDLLPPTTSSSSSSSPSDTLQVLFSTLRQINPTALVQTASYGQVPDWNWIFDIHSLDMDHRTLQHVVDDIWNDSTAAATSSDQDEAHYHDDSNCTDPNCQDSHHHGAHDHELSPHDHSHHHPESHDHNRQHLHTSGVSTITLSHDGSVDLSRVNAWVASILWPHQDEADKVLRARLEQNPEDDKLTTAATAYNPITSTATAIMLHDQKEKKTQQIFRIKGILSVRRVVNDNDHNDNYDDDDRKWIDPSTGLDRRFYIVQSVHDLWEIHPSQNEQFLWDDDINDRRCKLIVIGQYLDAASLRASFQGCAV